MSSSNSRELVHDLAENFGYASYFNHLLKTGRAVDVTFILETEGGEVEFSAHQLVLAMRSVHFADMFYGDHKEKENKIIRLEKVNPKAFEDMIRYCYDCKPSLEKIEDISTLFKVAYQFKVTSFMNLCRSCLKDMEITPGNVFSMVEVSEYMEDKKLRDTCYKYLEKKTKCVMEAYEMSQVTETMVHIILDLPKLSLHSEYELIKWMINWANIKVEEGNTVCRNAREYLRNFLEKLNLLVLTVEEFLVLCKDYPDFFTSEEIACICLNIAQPGTKEMPDWYGKKMKIREYVGLTEKLIHRGIVAEEKYVLDISVLEESLKCFMDISVLEEFLKCFMETINKEIKSFFCCSERIKKFKEKDIRVVLCEYALLLKIYVLFYKICKKLLEMVGKGDELERLEINEKLSKAVSKGLEILEMDDVKAVEEKVKLYDVILVLSEGGGMKYLLEIETELKEMWESDGTFEILKEFSSNEDEVKKVQEKLENDKEYQTMKKMLQNVNELEMIKMLENLDTMYGSYKECESLNEFLKEMRPLVFRRIKRLSENYFEFVMEIRRLFLDLSELFPINL